MVPLTRHALQIDLFAFWGAPVIVCASTKLGTINHSLLSIEALKRRALPLLGIAFIGEENARSRSAPSSRLGQVHRLGRLPHLDPLDAPTLHAAFDTHFRRADFVSGEAVMTARDPSPIWHPFTQHALQPEMIEIARGEGAWLETPGGNRILDAISSWWVITHGHRYPPIVAAIKEQADRLDQVIFAGFTHEPAEHLARGLIETSAAGSFSCLFFR